METVVGTPMKPFAVVTGASSGIGYELARQFSQHGFDLLIAAEDTMIHQAASELRGIGNLVESMQVDLAKYDDVEQLYGRIVSMGRPVDAIAINAGVGVSGDFARETELKDELNLIELNVVSTVHLAKRVLNAMVKQGRGRVLFSSSIAAEMPGPFEAIYAASKAFIQSFSQALRNELKESGVSVTSLMPGATETNFFHRAGMDDTRVGQSEKDDPAEVARQGFEALMAGKDHIVTGSFKNRLQTAAAKILPEPVVAELHRKQAEPGSAGGRGPMRPPRRRKAA